MSRGEMKRKRGAGARPLLLAAAAVAAALAIAAPASAKIVQRIAWGSEGSGAGRFADPQGVAVDAAGHVYVADRGNDRIQKFSARGEFILMWGWGVRNGRSELQTCRRSCERGIYGSGRGQLFNPYRVVPDGEGHVYVADTSNSRIQKFTGRGRFLDRWGSEGSGPGQLHGPVGLALGRAGRVYVADFYNSRIQKFSRRGRFIDQWGASSPFDLATDADGNVYAAEYYADRVEKFSPGGRLLTQWGGVHGDGEGEFNFPEGIATDDQGRVYVADSGNERIQKFTGSGRFLTAWGELGEGRGQFDLPSDVAIDSAGRVYVADTVNARIVKYAQVPPRTTIVGSKVSDARKWAEFRFKASERGSDFRCRLDRRRFRPCDSPKAYSDLGAGEHVFKVRAVGPDMLRDPTPAKERFRIAE